MASALSLAWLVVAPTPLANATAGDIGFRDQSFSGVTNPPTSDKPQSKLWFNDGLWWATMFDATSETWHIFRLDRGTNAWVDTGTRADDRAQSLSDALWDGTHLFIASHYVTISTVESPKASIAGLPARLYRYTYSTSSKTYTLESGFPVNINNNSSESLTIDEDSNGRIWATWTKVTGSESAGYSSSVYVNSSATGQSWGTPTVLPVAGAVAGPDDISGIVAYGTNKIGVMWSNHVDDTMYWAWRTDSQPLTNWTGSVAIQGRKQADDHMNLKAIQSDQAGRVFAAVKTSFDELSGAPSTSPQIELLVFKPATGSWTMTPVGTLADCHTRPIVMLDEENQKVHVIATAPSSGGCPFSGSPGTIYDKVASMDNPSFSSGRGTPIIRDAASAHMNNPTSTKQPVNGSTGLVVLAGNTSTSRYWHADIALNNSNPAPTASFTASPTSGTAPLAVSLTDTSTGSPTSWAWDFGNGQTSTLQNPSTTYTSAGTYTVSLTASNAGGSSAPATQTITVSAAPPPAPTASFTASPTSGTAPLTVSFTDTSTGSPTSWAWDFGNGQTSTLQNPSTTYGGAGTYTVSLTASNAGGSSAPTTRTITLTPAPPPAPTASFTASPTSGTAPLTVTLTDTSTGSPTSWAWNFGNGQTSTLQNPSVTYASAGTYTVSLTASNANGPSTPVTQTITVTAPSTGIARAGTATTVNAVADTGITIATPAGTSTGDVLVACLTLNGSTVAGTGAPAGWTQLAAVTGVVNPHVYGYYRVAGAAEPASYHWTYSSAVISSGGIGRYTGASGLDTTASTASGASSTTATVAGVTTTTANAMLVGCAGINSGSTAVTITGPGGMTELWDLGGKRQETDDGLQAAAGASGAKTWTLSSGREWAAWLVALRPS
jgi:PKD repeat protein